ncbi:hypothetical protein DDZ13_03305 [Coraliomargarita sinensis]|uniref:Uncharacterized protein n=1 Tax=Coraliomargarita sinensis TaxID=2174842 RepID=A0A317ZLG4_9BACT|nr:hypothetical protein [Coraliomargarita sinensis]PXA05007.1 hypothetical protein DDZ13_03305 [Coraliomargarita sinensis]
MIGITVVPAAFILPVFLDDSNKPQFIVPGSHEFEVGESARYYLWNDHQTVFEGKSYDRSESLPDEVSITIRDEAGQTLPFTPNTSIYSTVGNSIKNSIGYVDVPEPGLVSVNVSGSFEPRVFSFSEFGFLSFLGKIFAAIGLSALFALAGLGIAIWGIVRLARESNERPPDAVA